MVDTQNNGFMKNDETVASEIDDSAAMAVSFQTSLFHNLWFMVAVAHAQCSLVLLTF